MDRPMQMVAVMQEFGWTYDEYMRTPTYVLELIREKMTRDRKEQELASRTNNRGFN